MSANTSQQTWISPNENKTESDNVKCSACGYSWASVAQSRYVNCPRCRKCITRADVLTFRQLEILQRVQRQISREIESGTSQEFTELSAEFACRGLPLAWRRKVLDFVRQKKAAQDGA